MASNTIIELPSASIYESNDVEWEHSVVFIHILVHVREGSTVHAMFSQKHLDLASGSGVDLTNLEAAAHDEHVEIVR